MASNVVNLTDFMRALAQDPEAQRELQIMLFPSGMTGVQSSIKALVEAQQRTETQVQSLAGKVEALAEAQQRTEAQVRVLAEAQQRTEAQVRVLAEAQQRTEAQIQALAGKVDTLADGQRELQASIATLTRSLGEMEQRFTVRLGRLDGHYLEAKYLQRPYSFFGTLVHKARAVPLVDLADELTSGLSEDEFKDILNLDVLVRGKLPGQPDQPDIWLAVEVSVVVDSHDVDRAERRAAALRKLGLRTIPVAAGEVATEGAIEQARDHGVLLLQDGRSRFWREALLAHPG